MTSNSNRLSRLVKLTLIVGVPLSLLGVLAGWNTHPGGGLLFLVALVPSALLASRDIIPREYFWFAFPFVQFAYYFCWAALIFGVRALFKAGAKSA
jgi:hypothetical protein